MSNIAEIDQNFAEKNITQKGEGIVYELPCEPFRLYGGSYTEDEGFFTIPHDIAKSINDGVEWGAQCGSGMRLTFATDSKSIRLEVKAFAPLLLKNMAFIGSNAFTLTEKDDDGERFVDNIVPPTTDNGYNITLQEEYRASAKLTGGRVRNYVLYFPLYSGIKRLKISFDANSVVTDGTGYRSDIAPIMYYGSSITQGASASRANNMYQCYIAEHFNVDYMNYGFSGSAKAEIQMAEYLASKNCSIFVYDYDHNAPSTEYLEQTHERLFKLFREKHRDTPVIFMTKPDHHELDGIDSERDERAAIIYRTYKNALESGDKNVYFIDCRRIFPKDVREHCFIDGIHPNDLGMHYMANALIEVIERLIPIDNTIK